MAARFYELASMALQRLTRETWDSVRRSSLSTFSSAGVIRMAREERTGHVKWFIRAKGYGFLTCDDGTDVFLPLRSVTAAGLDRLPELPEGTPCSFLVEDRERGPVVSEILKLDLAAPRVATGHHRGPQPAGADRGALVAEEEVTATVKWFDPDRGYGFATPDDGGDDVFIHAKTLRAAGIDELDGGVSVRLGVRRTNRGRDAVTVEIIE
jgi:CspA family cold shock protein